MSRIELQDIDRFFKPTLIKLLLVGIGVFLPLPLLSFFFWIERSEFIEEAAKGLVVILVAGQLYHAKERLLWSAIFGLCFGLSEAVFYLSDTGLNTMHFMDRMFSTIPMHTLTALLVMLPIVIFRTKKAGMFGIALALAVHLVFNEAVGPML